MNHRIFNITIKMKSSKGFILPFTMLISTIVLFIMSGSMVLLSKQLYFSKLSKQSQAAYYAADDAISCATSVDDSFYGNDGLGIFPSDPAIEATTYITNVLASVNITRAENSLTQIADIEDIKCAQAVIFDPSSGTSKFTVTSFSRPYYDTILSSDQTEHGKTSTFTMRMNLGDGTYRCAKVTVNKTPSWRQIIAQGYASCDTANGAVERAVVNTTISE